MGENPLLGTTAKTASKKETKNAVANGVIRFWLQDLAGVLLPKEKVAQCMKRLAPINPEAGKKAYCYQTVEVHYNYLIDRASYRNLMICDRIWFCAVCAAKISERRRVEISQGIKNSQLYVVMVTYTLRHRKADSLEHVLTGLTAAHRRLKAGGWWQRWVKEFGWLGDIRGLEITHGDCGWHPHIHALMFFDHPLSSAELGGVTRTLKRRFKELLAKTGHSATLKHGVVVSDDDRYVNEYVAKFGRLPQVDLGNEGGWTAAHEVAKSNVKMAKTEDGRTPWQLLLDYGAGDKQAGALFVEYATVFKGRRQLIWSDHLHDWLGGEEI
jgi:replication protein